MSIENADVATSSVDYARRFEGTVGSWFLKVQVEHTLKLLSPWSKGRVLDFGGGHGQLVGPLLDAGYDVTVYGSAPICEERILHWTQKGLVHFHSGDLLKSFWREKAFDIVLSYRLLPHVARWQTLVAELCRLARYAVLVDYPSSSSINAFSRPFFGVKKGIEKNTRPFTVFKDTDVTDAFVSCGFQVTGRSREFLFPMALHRGMGMVSLSQALEATAAHVGLTHLWGSPVILRVERHV